MWRLLEVLAPPSRGLGLGGLSVRRRRQQQQMMVVVAWSPLPRQRFLTTSPEDRWVPHPSAHRYVREADLAREQEDLRRAEEEERRAKLEAKEEAKRAKEMLKEEAKRAKEKLKEEAKEAKAKVKMMELGGAAPAPRAKRKPKVVVDDSSQQQQQQQQQEEELQTAEEQPSTRKRTREKRSLEEELNNIRIVAEADMHDYEDHDSLGKSASELFEVDIDEETEAATGKRVTKFRAPIQLPDPRFKALFTQDEFAALKQRMELTKVFALDLETNSLTPSEAEIVGLSICCDDAEAYYIPFTHTASAQTQLSRDWVLQELRPLLESPEYKKVGHNLKFDMRVLLQPRYGIDVRRNYEDTMVIAYNFRPGERVSLEAVSERYRAELDFDPATMLSFEDVTGKGKHAVRFDEVDITLATRYAAEDAWLTFRLFKVFERAWRGELPLVGNAADLGQLRQVYELVDMPMVNVLAKMENEGVSIDEAYLADVGREFNADLDKIKARILDLARGFVPDAANPDKPLNLNSMQQLNRLLFEHLSIPPPKGAKKLKNGSYSTDIAMLKTLAEQKHEVPMQLREYREVTKLMGTYVDPLREMRDKTTGRLHASFHQAVTATGRLSSSQPNLQNIPIRSGRGAKIRKAFVPSPGNVLFSADYSQIELRVLAHMSQDRELIRSFRANEDVHRRTASEIFDTPEAKVDDRQRSIAKAINFGLIYGKSSFGLAAELKMERWEAEKMIKRYFQKYSSVQRFLDGQVAEGRSLGRVRTMMGRIRELENLRKPERSRDFSMAKRMAYNTPIQGTAADLMRVAMIEISNQIEERGLGARMIIQVHDEVVVDAPQTELEDVKHLLKDCMENRVKRYMDFSVPLKVNIVTGSNWLEM